MLAVAVALAATLVGCASQGGGPLDGGAGPYDLGTPGAVVSTTPHLSYYPACGNEILTFDGTRWYIFAPANSGDFPTAPLADTSAPATGALGVADGSRGPGGIAMGVHRVVAPGPGDDVGTLVIYKNNLAHWESDSGRLSRWLTTREMHYNWAC
jgi:hypothetical protein